MRARRGLTTVLTLGVSFVVWEAVVRLFEIPQFLVPAPSAVWTTLRARGGFFVRHAYVTLGETVAGFLVGLVVGIALALLITYSRRIADILLPLVVIGQIIPKVAIAPLLLIWFGYGALSKVLIAFLIGFFPIVVNTAAGLRSVEPEMLELVRSLRATNWQIFRKVRLPQALPHVASGMKISITLAVIGAVVGEFVGGNQGLGYLIIVSNYEVNTPLMFAALFLLSLLGLALYGLIALLERLLIPWSLPEEESEEPLRLGT